MLPEVRFKGIADAAGAHYLPMDLGNKLRMIGRAAWRRVATPQ